MLKKADFKSSKLKIIESYKNFILGLITFSYFIYLVLYLTIFIII